MAKRGKVPAKQTRRKSHDFKKEAAQLIHKAGFDKEMTESLIKEMEEICAFEDSLEEF